LIRAAQLINSITYAIITWSFKAAIKATYIILGGVFSACYVVRGESRHTGTNQRLK